MKKLFNITLLLVISLLLFGCNKEKKEYITLKFEDKQYGFVTSFTYNRSLDYQFIDGPTQENEYANMKMTSNSLNAIVDFEYDEETKEQYGINKESVSKYDNYKEYKFNGYDAYTFSTGEDNLYSVIILGNNQDTMNTYIYLRFSLIDSSIKTNLKEVYENEGFQEFLNSISYK